MKGANKNENVRSHSHGRKSFYGKAKVEVSPDGSETLYSYNTPIIKKMASGDLVKLWSGWSATTGRHIAAFCGLNKAGFMALSRFEAIKEVLKGLPTAALVSVHNEYCEANSDMDNYIYSMEEFDEILSGYTPWEVARACYYSGKFCPAHDYFWYNGYGNLVSDDSPGDQIYIDDIAAYIDRTDNALYNTEIQELLDEYEDEETEKE